MKINAITIRNLLGVRDAEIVIDRPIAIVGGGNGQGKSSIRDAVALALTGVPSRVNKASEMKDLIAEGCKTATIGVNVTIDAQPMMCTAAIPSSKAIAPRLDERRSAVLPFVVNPELFAKVDEQSRRALIQMIVPQQDADLAAVRKRLEKDGVAQNIIDEAEPLLLSGFDAASAAAAKRATEAKGEWRAATGEAWGAKKAEDWSRTVDGACPHTAEEVEAAYAVATTIAETITNLNRDIGAAQAAFNVDAEQKQLRETLKAKADGLDKAKSALAMAITDRDAMRSTVDQLRLQATSKSSLPEITHSLAADLREVLRQAKVDIESSSALCDYDTIMQSDNGFDARSKLPQYEKSLALLEHCVTNKQSAYDAAAQAAQTLATLGPVSAADPSDLDDLHAQLTDAQLELNQHQAIIQAAEDYARKVQDAKEATEKAANANSRIAAWTLVAELFSPSGIQGEAIAKQIKPLNDHIARQALALNEFDAWPTPTIGADMEIRIAGRRYGLLSESEKWRVDLLFADVIAKLSGLNVFMMDRVDVLSLDGRNAMMCWAEDRAAADPDFQAILLGTFKAPLTNLPDAFCTFWVADGKIASAPAFA